MRVHDFFRFIQQFNLDAYITYMTDEHLNEFVGLSDKRIEYLTGFTGSFGIAITSSASAFYTDSRYTLQSKVELQGYDLIEGPSLVNFMSENLKAKRVGICLKYISSKQYTTMKTKLSKILDLVEVEEDLVNSFWDGRPSRSFNEVLNLEKFSLNEYLGQEVNDISGCSYLKKLESIRKLLRGDEGILVSQLDTIAWIFNLRGSDIPYSTTFYSYAFITKTTVDLFIKPPLKLPHVCVHSYEDFDNFLDTIRGTVQVSGDTNAYIIEKLKANDVSAKYTNKINELKSIKNQTEITGFKLANIYDSIALTKLFYWIKKNIDENITENDVAKKLLEFRKENPGFIRESFNTIVATGKNGAFVHHQSNDTPINKHSMLLIDAGSHYFFGTTDISRSLHFGDPTEEEKVNYTLVLKGIIAAKTYTGPKIVVGELDKQAKKYLKMNSKGYDHATGHGIGHVLNVHEHPPIISTGDDVLKPHQVFSIEPGFYKEDGYGIRIEDNVFIEKNHTELHITDLTYLPYSFNLIDIGKLTDKEINYLNKHSVKTKIALLPFFEHSPETELINENTRIIAK